MAIELFQQVAIGTPVTSSTLVVGEVPSGDKDDSNTIFTLANTPATLSTALYLRGQRLIEADATDGFTRSGVTLTLGSSVTPPSATDPLVADYRKA